MAPDMQKSGRPGLFLTYVMKMGITFKNRG